MGFGWERFLLQGGLKILNNYAMGGVVRVKGQGLMWGGVCRESILRSIKSEKGKKVACPLRVGGETLVEEFKYLGGLVLE